MIDSDKKLPQDFSSKPPVKDPVIKITGRNGNNLELSDDGVTVTNKHNTVTWEIDTNLVEEIVDIQRKTNSEEVFDEKPKKVDKAKWDGKTKDPGHDIITEYYSIYYTKPGDPVIYIDDPIIQLNP